MATKLLTKQTLRKLYRLFIELPPFNEYRMPAPHKVNFRVIKSDDVLGYFHSEPYRIEIDVTCDSWLKISETMLHEMIHLCRCHNGHNDFTEHNEKFNIYAKRICNLYNFNLDEF
jgi:hypothetical protein